MAAGQVKPTTDLVSDVSLQSEAGPATLPAVSVCVLSWNTRDVLRQCLASLYSGPGAIDLEVIVVDNASEDGSAEMVAVEFPQVRLLRQTTNLMFARGMNCGARAARGRYLLFLNSDCFITQGTLSEMVAFMERQPAAMLAAPRQVRGDGRVESTVQLWPGLTWTLRRLLLLPTSWTRRRLSGGAPRLVRMVSASCLLARGELAETVGLFDEDFSLGVEDSELCYRVRQAGYGVWFLPSCQAMHLHAQSRRRLSRGERARHMVEGALLFCRKHYRPSYRRALAVCEALLLARDVAARSALVAITLGLDRRARESLSTALVRARLVRGLWQTNMK